MTSPARQGGLDRPADRLAVPGRPDLPDLAAYGMTERHRDAQSQKAQFDDYVRSVAGQRQPGRPDRQGQAAARQRRDQPVGVRRDQGQGPGGLAPGRSPRTCPPPPERRGCGHRAGPRAGRPPPGRRPPRRTPPRRGARPRPSPSPTGRRPEPVGAQAAGVQARPRARHGHAPGDLELVAAEGTAQTGTPAARAFCVAPMPPWVIAQAARSSTGPCGTKGRTWALAGRAKAGGVGAGSVATTCTGSSARASSAVATSRPSSWNSEEVVTRTIGRSTSASQAGGVGRRVPGARADHPDVRGPVVRGYSNGSAVR